MARRLGSETWAGTKEQKKKEQKKKETEVLFYFILRLVHVCIKSDLFVCTCTLYLRERVANHPYIFFCIKNTDDDDPAVATP